MEYGNSPLDRFLEEQRNKPVELDILDELEEEKGYVKLTLTSGEEIYGKSDIVIFEEDEEDDDEIVKTIRFLPYKEEVRYYKLEDIKEYKKCKKDEIEDKQVKRKLYDKLKTISDDKDFVGGVISISKGNEERQIIIDFIDRGVDVTVASVTLLAIYLKKNR